MVTTVGTCFLTWGLTKLSDLYLISSPASVLSFGIAATECYFFADIGKSLVEGEDATDLEEKCA